MSEAENVDPLVGRVIADSYVIQELVGIGGMGRVYRAEQRALGRMVAVKLVHRHLLNDKDSVARFYTEARAASSLNHPNSVGIFDFGRTDDGLLYLVMEYLRGKDLAYVMDDTAHLPLGRIVQIALGVLAALGEAHARGVVHRDLKPENIIVERLLAGTDLVKVLDFGLAKIRGAEPLEGASGLVAGTPDYMSPEQARGLEVDGRGDLYSLGVLLFELLCGRLPYVADTPSNVMLKHVVDPIPDPRQVAPYRGVPDALADVVMRALAKSPDERFEDADAMAARLRQVAAALDMDEGRVRCLSCGATNEARSSYCGDCGRRLSVVPAAPGTGLMSLPPPGERPLLGRSEAFERLMAIMRAGGKARAVYVVGELGVGKTRLLAELGAQAGREGHLVVRGEPHPSGAKVGYAAVRQVVTSLMNVTEARFPALVDDEALARDPLVRAGLFELLLPEGLPGQEGRSRAGAVAAVLARAATLSRSRAPSGSVVLVFDDLGRCDGLTADVLAELGQHAADLPLVVVVASAAPLPLSQRFPGPTLALQTLPAACASEFVRDRVVPPEAFQGGFLPLHLEQLRALRWQPSQGEPFAPSLAEAVIRRLNLLNVQARRVIQAVSVLGERVSLEDLRHIVDSEDLPALAKLTEHGFLRPLAGSYAFVHPYLCDVVEASIPAETRKELHARALDLSSSRGDPLEVRAEHAFRSGDVMTALMLLERSGQEALKRGDPAVSTLAFRRGLELARREVLETGDEALDPAIVSFSRQLAESLVWTLDVTGAAGVLNEAFSLAGPQSLERARMVLLLGRVAERRDRPREAIRQLGLSAELAQQLGDKALEARALWALSRVRRSGGDNLGAANAMSRSTACWVECEPRSPRRAQAEIELGELFLELGDHEAAQERLERALELCEEADCPALSAGALGVLASLDELSGRRDVALGRYREAVRLSARSGDASGHRRWLRAEKALSPKR